MNLQVSKSNLSTISEVPFSYLHFFQAMMLIWLKSQLTPPKLTLMSYFLRACSHRGAVAAVTPSVGEDSSSAPCPQQVPSLARNFAEMLQEDFPQIENDNELTAEEADLTVKEATVPKLTEVRRCSNTRFIYYSWIGSNAICALEDTVVLFYVTRWS